MCPRLKRALGFIHSTGSPTTSIRCSRGKGAALPDDVRRAQMRKSSASSFVEPNVTRTNSRPQAPGPPGRRPMPHSGRSLQTQRAVPAPGPRPHCHRQSPPRIAPRTVGVCQPLARRVSADPQKAFEKQFPLPEHLCPAKRLTHGPVCVRSSIASCLDLLCARSAAIGLRNPPASDARCNDSALCFFVGGFFPARVFLGGSAGRRSIASWSDLLCAS
jgi:hypothetical protein